MSILLYRPLAVAALLLAGAILLPAVAFAQPTVGERPEDAPIVIGHRGASGYRPEHTLAAYRLAIAQGADYVEPDLVSTADGVLVARHENEISGTTDVADHPEFADRRTTKVIDGVELTGWFTEDFTLAELKTLRAVERIPDIRPDNTAFNGMFEIPTLQEIIDLVKSADRPVGIYPETKHPTYFDSIGLSLEEPLVETLHANGYRGEDALVFVQSFETANLRELNTMTDLPLVQLIGGSGAPADLVAAGDPRTYADLVTPAGLAEIATYADGIGPDKSRIVPRDAFNRLLEATTLVADAHAEGLVVHPYTFRRENVFLPADFQLGDPSDGDFPRLPGDLAAELRLFFRLGVDGVFTDNPDIAVAVRNALFPECTIAGTAGDDVLRGTEARDVICAGEGDDEVSGRGGNDVVFAGDGDDTVRGGDGNDTVWAGGGDDRVLGDRGADELLGGEGDDLLNGGRYRDRLHGGAGDDDVRGGRGNDMLSGGTGDDDVYGDRGRDSLHGEMGDDLLHGSQGDDAADGGTGTDVCNGAAGRDSAVACERLLNTEQDLGVVYETALTGATEVDPETGELGVGDTDGAGTASVTVNVTAGTLCFQIAVEGIGLPAAGAHVHEAPAGVSGPVVVPLEAPGADGTASGCVEDVERSLLVDISANPADYYVNVHTAVFAAGAVRGQHR